jgi:hypothetical protein
MPIKNDITNDITSTTIYLLCQKWRGSIIVSSMRYFETIQDLEVHVRAIEPDKLWLHHAYRVYPDGTEAKSLTQKECSAIGLR